ncbi:CHAT domain-containing protein [Streptomyces sp. NPDC049627]|uniref:CHAT domain-containing protein n=1 Tax=Streptomyces sp. NPDC049627 TaxID=3365595 RepID=UPI0037B1CFC9
MSRNLGTRVVRNPSHDFTHFPPPTAQPPHLVVALNEYGQDRIFIRLYGPAVETSPYGDPSAILDVRPRTVQLQGARLRRRWKAEFVDAQPLTPEGLPVRGRPERPYATQVDLTGEPEDELLPVLEELAAQGAYLLFKVLLAGPDQRTSQVRRVLTDLLSRKDLRIRFDSDTLFLPWPLLCLPEHETPDGGLDAVFRRFLGYRHQIEQTGGYYPELPTTQSPAPPPVSPSVSLNHDTRVDAAGWTKASEVAAVLARNTTYRERCTHQDLVNDIAAGKVDEQFMYFWCHGWFQTEDADSPFFAVQLSDGRDIDAQTVLARCSADAGTPLSRNPLVLLNACYAGVPGSAGLAHLGGALIQVGAAGVLGPQIEMPQVFAAEYALLYVTRYLTGEETAGVIARDLARHFADKHRNPLGLAYALHCGMNSRLERGL